MSPTSPTPGGTIHPARRLWHLIESIHAVTYFAEPCRVAMSELGLRGFWMGYVAGRAAPLGAVAAPVVGATFMNFAPERIQRAVPEAWERTTPDAVLAARADAAAVALRQALPDADEHARRAVPLLEQAARAANCDGRPLAAANQAVMLPVDPVARMWQLCTTLREHRGDGHVAAWVSAGVTGLGSLVVAAGAGVVERDAMRAARGWSEAAWDAAAAALVDRGLLDDDGALTPDGAALHLRVEADTDHSALPPFRDGLTETGLDLLATVLRHPATQIGTSGVLPFPNPIGLPRP